MTVDVDLGTGLRQILTGVTLLTSDSLDPVVIAAGPTSPDFDIQTILPLLTRRHTVFIAGMQVRARELPDRFALIVAPTYQTPLITDARVSALILLGSTAPTLVAPCPVLVITPAGLTAVGPPTADVRFAEAGHPSEQAHLIDAFLRDPQRYPAQSTIPRAQP